MCPSPVVLRPPAQYGILIFLDVFSQCVDYIYMSHESFGAECIKTPSKPFGVTLRRVCVLCVLAALLP